MKVKMLPRSRLFWLRIFRNISKLSEIGGRAVNQLSREASTTQSLRLRSLVVPRTSTSGALSRILSHGRVQTPMYLVCASRILLQFSITAKYLLGSCSGGQA